MPGTIIQAAKEQGAENNVNGNHLGKAYLVRSKAKMIAQKGQASIAKQALFLLAIRSKRKASTYAGLLGSNCPGLLPTLVKARNQE